MRNDRAVATLGGFALSLGLIACGDDDSEAEATEAEATETEQPETEVVETEEPQAEETEGDDLFEDLEEDLQEELDEWEELLDAQGSGLMVRVGDEGYFVFSLPSTGFESTGDLGPSEEQLEAQIELAELILERM